MTAVAGSATPPACAADPDRWFDPRRRNAALVTCLQCPVRRRCARDALRANATEGMWAGVWIDGYDESAVRLLQSIAADWPLRRRTRAPEPAPVPVRREPPPLPRCGPLPRCPVAAAVDARATGHCEVMAPGCRLSGDRHLSRVAGRHPAEAVSAAEVFCACDRCAEMIARADDFGRDSGFVVGSANAAERTAVHWRAARRVLLGPAGELTEVSAVETRCA